MIEKKRGYHAAVVICVSFCLYPDAAAAAGNAPADSSEPSSLEGILVFLNLLHRGRLAGLPFLSYLHAVMFSHGGLVCVSVIGPFSCGRHATDRYLVG